MKILAFVDLHGDEAILNSIINTAKKENVDFLVNAGDICNWGKDLEKIFKKLKSAGIPMFSIPGNHEDLKEHKEVVEKFSDFAIDLNKKLYCLGDYCFMGYGEGVFDEEDKDFEKMIQKFQKEVGDCKKLVLITHAPPYKTELDKMAYFGHVGNRSFRRAIIKLKPSLFICGHIEENSGKIDNLGKTVLMNPGPVGRIIEV